MASGGSGGARRTARAAICEPINNGVYRSGFARTREAYQEAVGEVFAALDHWEEMLGRRRYLHEVYLEARRFAA